jgi:MoaA/NifB/PqqE/SkfB family radical SAM enzyme
MGDTKFHQSHEELAEKIYNNPEMLPSRYVYVLTNCCNLRCDFCFQDKEPKEDAMTSEDWINLTKQLPEYSRVTMTGGEPLMLKGFNETFDYVAKRFPCNLITNGLLLTPEKIDFLLSYPNFKVLSISIDNIGNTIRGVLPVHWNHLKEMIKYFNERKKEIGSDCLLDIKTMILDGNAKDLFEIYRYLVEDLGAGSHAFQFLKGSPIQHADKMFSIEDIRAKSGAHVYINFEEIEQQLEKIRQYNLEKGRVSFLHPKVASLNSEEPSCGLKEINAKEHLKEKYLGCKFVWSSVHINFDGKLFPCLAIEMGNVKKYSLKEIIQGTKFKEFRELIQKEGTLEACNRCGWLRPKEK